MVQNESDSEYSEHKELYKESTTTNQSKVKTLKLSLQQSYIESASADMGELTILNSVEEIIDDMKDVVEIKEVDALLGIIHKTINISVLMITIGMLEKIKKSIV
ncbi:921_t:CDS:2 [Racocetra persica]|uniref:921_t:CDS:1 n=1 Tax=Racocetra persica TaxID=160502 RepID=A0ACA9NCF3_9GLOM|nr:921_t:CDS:2 [Racocetra persica]